MGKKDDTHSREPSQVERPGDPTPPSSEPPPEPPPPYRPDHSLITFIEKSRKKRAEERKD